MTSRSILRAGVLAALLAAAAPAAAQQLIIYPAKGQSPQQQQKDQGECQVAGPLRTVEKNIPAVAQALARCPMIDPGHIESTCNAF